MQDLHIASELITQVLLQLLCVLVWNRHSALQVTWLLLSLQQRLQLTNREIVMYSAMFPIICCTISVLLLLNKLSFTHSHSSLYVVKYDILNINFIYDLIQHSHQSFSKVVAVSINKHTLYILF